MNERLQAVFDEGIQWACLSEKKKGGVSKATKVELSPFQNARGELLYQFSSTIGPKVFHQNFTPEAACEEIQRLLTQEFQQMMVRTAVMERHITWYHKLKIHAGKRRQSPQTAPAAHNKVKNYPLPEGEPCDFLIRLGVMTPDGRVCKAKYDKFRQINRYLELIAPAVSALDTSRRLHIVDFGCGKAYLTFALYYYLTQRLGLQVQMTGLDLKEDVIALCQGLAQELGYGSLSFQTGDIKSFSSDGDIDMVITLHACDTATDEAIVQALSWNAKVILTVPCCQHELFSQIHNESMRLLTKHGILKERLSCLITDSIRCQLLEACGYQTNIMEFISLEHTPKNLLIKAVRRGGPSQSALREYRSFAAQWGIEPYLERRLIQLGRIPPS